MKEEPLIQFRILLPHRVFLSSEIRSLQVETSSGWHGFHPRRRDGVTALPPGLLTYIAAEGEEKYVAVDQGILVKAGTAVTLAVRNAISGANLGELHAKVREEFQVLDEEALKVRQVMSQLETGFVRNFEKLVKE